MRIWGGIHLCSKILTLTSTPTLNLISLPAKPYFTRLLNVLLLCAEVQGKTLPLHIAQIFTLAKICTK